VGKRRIAAHTVVRGGQPSGATAGRNAVAAWGDAYTRLSRARLLFWDGSPCELFGVWGVKCLSQQQSWLATRADHHPCSQGAAHWLAPSLTDTPVPSLLQVFRVGHVTSCRSQAKHALVPGP
jgi:hypothetical protein